jgi:hypothetical protein
MSLVFTNSAEQAATNGMKMLVYGASGTGKTVLCSTLPNVVMLSAEAGALSLTEQNLRKIYPTAPLVIPVPIILIRNVDDLAQAYQWLTTSVEARQFQSVALDSLSEIGEVVLNNAKRQVKDPRQAYGELIEKMETLIRAYRDLPGKHVYMAAKMESIRDDLTSTTKYSASMPGAKLGNKLPYFFDFVFRLGIGQAADGTKYRFLQTSPDLQFEAKDRSGKLDAMEYPHLGNVISKVLA